MFYQQLSKYYDQVFPCRLAVVSFLQRYLRTKGRILDAACGTGTYAQALASQGFTVVGIDLEPRMIEQARHKNTETAAEFLVGDMLDIGSLGCFDGIICLGNSLAHLTEPTQLGTFFDHVSKALTNGGSCIVQIVNFDRILDQGETRLPSLGDEEVEFTRTYRPIDQDRLEFSSVLTVKSSQMVYENTIYLRPITSGRLHALFVEHGLTVRFSGDFQGAVYDPTTSGSLVAVGHS